MKRFLRAIWMWTWAIVMIAILAPLIYLDAWLERRERRKHTRKFL